MSDVRVRLGWAIRMKRRPRSAAGMLRLLWHDFVTHGLFGPGGERCQDCGRDYPLWHADGDLWDRVHGGPGGLLCPHCFDRQAVKRTARPGKRVRLRRLSPPSLAGKEILVSRDQLAAAFKPAGRAALASREETTDA